MVAEAPLLEGGVTGAADAAADGAAARAAAALSPYSPAHARVHQWDPHMP